MCIWYRYVCKHWCIHGCNFLNYTRQYNLKTPGSFNLWVWMRSHGCQLCCHSNVGFFQNLLCTFRGTSPVSELPVLGHGLAPPCHLCLLPVRFRSTARLCQWNLSKGPGIVTSVGSERQTLAFHQLWHACISGPSRPTSLFHTIVLCPVSFRIPVPLSPHPYFLSLLPGKNKTSWGSAQSHGHLAKRQCLLPPDQSTQTIAPAHKPRCSVANTIL